MLDRTPQTNLDARARNGDTALMLAAYLAKVDWVAELINAGAQMNQHGWTALHYAAAIGDEQIIAVLLNITHILMLNLRTKQHH